MYTIYKIDNKTIYECETESTPRVGELVCFIAADKIKGDGRMFAVISICHSIGGILHSQDTVVLLREIENDDNLRYET